MDTLGAIHMSTSACVIEYAAEDEHSRNFESGLNDGMKRLMSLPQKIMMAIFWPFFAVVLTCHWFSRDQREIRALAKSRGKRCYGRWVD